MIVSEANDGYYMKLESSCDAIDAQLLLNNEASHPDVPRIT